ncbi:MAG TPA: hypothetical protein VJH37_04855 [Candidatus Nanoarchaeia archaeon]|nr:hypothetical protein [Candidatus Nanoarchaeia archaeon]
MTVLNATTAFVEYSQQTYLYNSMQDHQTDSVDALVINCSKRWMFNYMTAGNPLLNFNNLSTRFIS